MRVGAWSDDGEVFSPHVHVIPTGSPESAGIIGTQQGYRLFLGD
jgi:hypothetical protein